MTPLAAFRKKPAFSPSLAARVQTQPSQTHERNQQLLSRGVRNLKVQTTSASSTSTELTPKGTLIVSSLMFPGLGYSDPTFPSLGRPASFSPYPFRIFDTFHSACSKIN
eukprot:g16102.t1